MSRSTCCNLTPLATHRSSRPLPRTSSPATKEKAIRERLDDVGIAPRIRVVPGLRHTQARSSTLDELRYIAASLVGAGVDRDSLDEALRSDPHFIACDAGTTDAGPFSLGSGRPAFPREAVKGDLALLLEAGRRARVPVLIGSAGTAGSDVQVDWTRSIAEEIAREAGVKLRTAVIYAEQDKDYLIEMLRQDRIKPLEAPPHLDEA